MLNQTRQAIACIFVSMLLCHALHAQSTRGTFSGTVTDSTGAVVPGATVTITNTATNVAVFTGTTNDEGNYVAPELPVGTYNIQVEAANFKRTEINNVPLAIDQRAVVDATLEAGAISEVVTISGENVGQIERETSEISQRITNDQVRNLPLPNRNVLNLLTLVAGVSSGTLASGQASVINVNQLSVNGSRTLNNEIQIDGVSVVGGDTGATSRVPSSEAVRELKVQTSAFSAEYGRTSGAFISAVIDSGTSDYHGALYEFVRNDKFNANNYFINARPLTAEQIAAGITKQPRVPERFNQFGARVGGPLPFFNFGEGGPVFRSGKQGTFFFVHYEGLRQSLPTTFAPSTIPETQFRSGNFSSVLAGADGIVGTIDDRVIRDPLRTGNCGVITNSSGQRVLDTTACFPGNIIPQNRLDPAAVRILGLLPAPNLPGSFNPTSGFRTANFVNSQSVSTEDNQLNARIDHTSFGGAGRTFGRFTYSKTTPNSSFDIPGVLNSIDAAATREDYQLALGHTQTLSPKLLAEVNFGVLRGSSIRNPTSNGIDVASVLGIQRSTAAATPRISIGGFQVLGTGATNPITTVRDVNTQLSGAISYLSGNNTLKIGAQYRHSGVDTFAGGTLYAGSYSFTGDITAPNTSGSSATAVNGLADFLLGAVRNASYQIPQPVTPRRNSNLGIFAQNDWKLTERLTLNLGLRYEYESPLYVANGIYARVDPANGELLVANRTNPRTGRAVDKSLDVNVEKLNLAPRVGLAYSLNDKTVIRTGFGVFYSQNFSNIGAIILVPGFTATRIFQNIGVGGAAQAQPFTLSQGAPLDTVQNLSDPFAAERNATIANPLAPGAQFADIRKLPRSYQYNFGVQRQLPGSIIVDVSYVGAQARNLPLSLQSNPIPFERAEELARIGNAQTTQAARRFPLVSAFGAIYNVGSSGYNSLQVKAQRQFAQNFAFQTAYTFSKSIDDGSGVFPFSQPNGIDVGQFPDRFRNLDRGLSSFDRPHIFSLSALYNTDGFPNAIRFLRGFQISPFFVVRSGLPDTITQNNFNPAVSQQRPNARNSNSIYAGGFVGEGGGVRYLVAPTDPNFPLAPSGPFFTGTGATRTLLVGSGIGSLGRNTVRLPRELNLDVTLSRRIRFTESIGLELRLEAFNVLNTVNFFGLNSGLTVGAVNNQAVFTNTNFGLLTQARPGRALQFGFKFEF